MNKIIGTIEGDNQPNAALYPDAPRQKAWRGQPAIPLQNSGTQTKRKEAGV